ncbi:MAG TPA: alpha/beta fold hydrolase [Armatimonadota bacterium]|nr:alpha/beta fold hydrolase [Armatimonadota bacterium]
MPGEELKRWSVEVGAESTTAVFEPAEGPEGSVLVLAHGAGGHMEHRTMVALAAELRGRGLHTVRFNFLYAEKKSGPPDRMPRLTECFAAVVERVRRELHPKRLLLGGHSMGGRTASMLAAEGFPCDGLLLLGYPLHPAGKPEKLRDAHLPQIGVPVLCLNGTRDDLCLRELMEPVVAPLAPRWTMHWLEAADHGFHVLKRSGRTDVDILREIGEAARRWVDLLPSPPPATR